MGESIEIHAGDFKKGFAQFQPAGFLSPACLILLKEVYRDGGYSTDIEKIPVSEIYTIEIADEEEVMNIESSICWAAAGAGLLGPVGLLAGLMFGKNDKMVTFIAKFRDGRQLLATTKSRTYDNIIRSIRLSCGLT